MSFLTATSAAVSMEAGSQGDASHSLFLGLAMTAAVVGVWALELRQRSGAAPPLAADGRAVSPWPSELRGSLQLLRDLLPEVVGLAICLVVAGVLLLNGANNGAPVTAEDVDIWQQIRNDWPILTTADSLLVLQAMLRMLVLASAAFRAKELAASPLAGWPLAFILLAAVDKAALLTLSPQDVYHLDGPLGGTVHVALEVGCLCLLVYLALTRLRSARSGPRGAAFLVAVAVLILAGWTAKGNRLALADPGSEHLDVLFSLGELLETAAAVAYLACAVTAGAGPRPLGAFAVFAGILLPLQHLLSAYFLLTAWGGAPLEEIPALVGAGRPLRTLQLAGVVQVGAYAAAGAVQLAFAGEEEAEKHGPLYIEL